MSTTSCGTSCKAQGRSFSLARKCEDVTRPKAVVPLMIPFHLERVLLQSAWRGGLIHSFDQKEGVGRNTSAEAIVLTRKGCMMVEDVSGLLEPRDLQFPEV